MFGIQSFYALQGAGHSYLDELGEEARLIGAVRFIRSRGNFGGYNTDGKGIL